MFSVIRQEKTALRDSRGGTVYRRAYLCDRNEDVASLPSEDAPGSVAYTADDARIWVLDHTPCWRPCVVGGIPWSV